MEKVLLLCVISVIILTSGCQKQQPDPKSFWKDGYCQQQKVQRVNADEKTIQVNTLEKGAQKFNIVNFPDSFVEWNTQSRLYYIDAIKKIMRGEGTGPRLAGPHNGIVATTGFCRDDAQFSLNNAVKGMGFIPKPEMMTKMLKLLEDTKDAPMPAKLEVLTSFYENLEKNFDLDKQGSLELYSQPQFMTQTFLNQMYNPISTVVFLDIPSYKMKTVARLLHPDDPQLTDYERQVVIWINSIHDYFHGPFNTKFIAVIYYVVQVYDNSPMGNDPKTGMGRRLMPILP